MHHVNPLPILQSHDSLPQSLPGRKRKRSSALTKDKSLKKDPVSYLNQMVCTDEGDGFIESYIPTLKNWKIIFREDNIRYQSTQRDRLGTRFKIVNEEEIKEILKRTRQSFIPYDGGWKNYIVYQ
jgi:hypothetical protein